MAQNHPFGTDSLDHFRTDLTSERTLSDFVAVLCGRFDAFWQIALHVVQENCRYTDNDLCTSWKRDGRLVDRFIKFWHCWSQVMIVIRLKVWKFGQDTDRHQDSDRSGQQADPWWPACCRSFSSYHRRRIGDPWWCVNVVQTEVRTFKKKISSFKSVFQMISKRNCSSNLLSDLDYAVTGASRARNASGWGCFWWIDLLRCGKRREFCFFFWTCSWFASEFRKANSQGRFTLCESKQCVCGARAMIATCRNNSEHGANRKAHCVKRLLGVNAMAFCTAKSAARTRRAHNMCASSAEILRGRVHCVRQPDTCALVLMENLSDRTVRFMSRHRPTAEELLRLSWWEIWKYLALSWPLCGYHFWAIHCIVFSPSSFLKSRFSQSISCDLHDQSEICVTSNGCTSVITYSWWIASHDYCSVCSAQGACCALHTESTEATVKINEAILTNHAAALTCQLNGPIYIELWELCNFLKRVTFRWILFAFPIETFDSNIRY